MNDAINFIIYLFGSMLIDLANIPFVLGYNLLQWLVAGSFMVLIWQLIIYILGRSSGVVRGGVKNVKRSINNYNRHSNQVKERWTK